MKTKQIQTEILIHASIEKVWKQLTDFNSYPEWNPFVKLLTGEVKVGEQIKINLPGMSFKPTVLVLDKEKELRWLGHLGFKGVFDGEHYFVLEAHGDHTKLIHGEKFKGILVPVMGQKNFDKTEAGFKSMNQALKARCEKKV